MPFTRSFCAVLSLALLPASFLRAETISVAAAVSLKETVTEIGRAYEAQGGDHVNFVFGASGQLLAQIKSGAPVDVFISAANKQMDDLSKAGAIVESSRRVVCGNEVVLIVPADSKASLDSFPGLTATGVGKVAIGEPKTVPAGQYAMQVLEKLNLTSALGERLIYGASVRQVLDYVVRGEVSAGIVYSTDAREAGDKVKVVATADAKWHEAIIYPAAIVKTSAKFEPAGKFLEYLTGEKGRAAFAAHGFTPATAPVK